MSRLDDYVVQTYWVVVPIQELLVLNDPWMFLVLWMKPWFISLCKKGRDYMSVATFISRTLHKQSCYYSFCGFSRLDTPWKRHFQSNSNSNTRSQNIRTKFCLLCHYMILLGLARKSQPLLCMLAENGNVNNTSIAIAVTWLLVSEWSQWLSINCSFDLNLISMLWSSHNPHQTPFLFYWHGI